MMNTQVSDDVKHAVARLRRYAFCLFGSLPQADEVIERCLRRFDPVRLAGNRDPLITLFRHFHEVGASEISPMWVSNGRAIGQEVLHGGLLRLPLKEREAVALRAVCGFRADEVATILGVSPERAQSLVDDGYRMLASPTLSALIIEDEPLLASDISGIVSGMGIEVIGMASRESEAVFKAAEKRPHLILADVRLAEGNGLNAVNTIRRFHEARVMYLTAFPGEVLRSVGERDALIVRKPFERVAVEAAVRQLAGLEMVS
ncbi:CheY-like chemotaxis protein [Rhodopseudomonas julia]|uniref:CheY-like chemotaxis protein n=1 Tax=Rhodopseudomonas julia TaxID=200617 RepID=A0ABU0C545_9BRAD|nr:response regulator [Rhodopseudomonas julia]MDQ0325632.1 CheY-like chemotaxis protein [Rhodopseudomonas julia]